LRGAGHSSAQLARSGSGDRASRKWAEFDVAIERRHDGFLSQRRSTELQQSEGSYEMSQPTRSATSHLTHATSRSIAAPDDAARFLPAQRLRTRAGGRDRRTLGDLARLDDHLICDIDRAAGGGAELALWPSAMRFERRDKSRVERLVTVLRQAWDTVLQWQERGRSRRQLLELDDHTLRDIGLSRGDALFEASKPFWR
jgi:uncharacterized protein YjiS (DUF1127 family)